MQKKHIIIAALGLLIALTAIAGIYLSHSRSAADGNQSTHNPQSSQDDTPQSTQTDTPASTPDSTPQASPLPEPVTNALKDALAGSDNALAQPSETPDLTHILADGALEAHNALREYLVTEGLRVSGKTQVISSEVIAQTDTTITAKVCLDTSEIRFVGADDTPESYDEQAPTRSSTIMTFVNDNGAWKLSEETFSEDPNC